MWVVEVVIEGEQTERIWLKAGALTMGRKLDSYIFSDKLNQQISRKQVCMQEVFKGKGL